jgi:hypothetical protein
MAGNANSGRRQEKPFRDALRMELAALKDDDPKALRAIARTLLETAASGDLQAIKEVADRTDGKAVQSVDADVTVTFEDILARLK